MMVRGENEMENRLVIIGIILIAIIWGYTIFEIAECERSGGIAVRAATDIKMQCIHNTKRTK